MSLDDSMPDRAILTASPSSDLEARVSSQIEHLSDNHRQLLDLYYYGELTLPEISRLLDRNLNTVKYQFYRAHSELAALLAKREEN